VAAPFFYQVKRKWGRQVYDWPPSLLAKLSGVELHKPAPQVSQQHHIWVKASAKFMQISAQVFSPKD
jgi:hypothetical protein